MSKFNLEKRVSLEYLGTEWKDCFLTFSSLSFKDVQEITKLRESNSDAEMTVKVFEILKKNFKSGQSYDGSKTVELEAADLEEMPIEVLTKVMTELVGGEQSIQEKK